MTILGWNWGRRLQSGCQREGQKQSSPQGDIPNGKRRGLLRKACICPCPDTHPDAFPNQLTPMRDSLCLVDGGLAINSPFPLILLSQRAVDLIVSFDYSLDAPFEVRGGGPLLGPPDWGLGLALDRVGFGTGLPVGGEGC